MEELIREMLEKGLIEVAREVGIHAADRLYQQIKILNYTHKQNEPDIFTGYLRIHRQN